MIKKINNVSKLFYLSLIFSFLLVSCSLGFNNNSNSNAYDLSGITFDDQTVVYDGQEHSLEINGVLPKGVIVNYSNNNFINAGTYRITAEFLDEYRHNSFISEMTATLTIEKAEYDMSGVTFDSKAFVYDGEKHTLEINGTLPKGVSVNYTNNWLTDIGSITATAKFSGDYHNYKPIPDMTAELTILPITDIDGNYIIDGVKYKNYDTHLSVIGYTAEINSSVSIYSQILDKPVTTIESNAFYGCNELMYISIPDCVIAIGNSAFFGCNALTDITISETVNNISDYAFSNCESLFSFTMLSNETAVGINILSGCDRLREINLPSLPNGYLGYLFGATSYSENEYYVPDSLEIITLSNSQMVEDYAFYGCNEIISVTISNNTTAIGFGIFSGCDKLEKIQFPFLPNDYLGYSFGATSKELHANQVPNTLKEVVLTNCTNIGSSAFARCYSLISIKIPDTVITIGDNAFSNCTGLTSFVIPNSVTTIGDYAFSFCTEITNIIIPESVTSIGNRAFSYCNLITITIPSSVTYIGGSPFFGNPNLTTIEVNNKNNYYDSRNNCNAIIDKKTNTLINGCASTIIPDGVTTIGSGAFSGSEKLETISIPDSVTKIDYQAFLNCTNLKSINIPDSVTELGEHAFNGCEGLTSISIPKSITSLKSHLFYDCKSLESIYIPDSIISIGHGAFMKCNSLTTFTIPSSVTTIGNSSFGFCKNLTYVEIPDSVTTIGTGLFENCTNLVSAHLPNSITSIPKYTFYGCKNLESFTISSNITSISVSAFYLCTGLKSISISDSVTTIEDDAFRGCWNLKDIYYSGTQTQWNLINKGNNVSEFSDVTVHYNSII